MDESKATKRQREIWTKAAPGYDRGMSLAERRLLGDSRRWVGARASGDVLEVGIGTGRSIPHYSTTLTSLTGADLAPAMLEIAAERAAQDGRRVRLVEADAERLPFEDAAFDTVVSQLALCSIPDPKRAIAEMARVLRPGGSLLLVDHIGSTWPPVFALQWLVERVTIPVAGEHFTRRQLPLVRAAGLEVVESERLTLGAVERLRAVR